MDYIRCRTQIKNCIRSMHATMESVHQIIFQIIPLSLLQISTPCSLSQPCPDATKMVFYVLLRVVGYVVEPHYPNADSQKLCQQFNANSRLVYSRFVQDPTGPRSSNAKIIRSTRTASCRVTGSVEYAANQMTPVPFVSSKRLKQCRTPN